MSRKGEAIMACTIQVRVDDELKTKSDNLFKELGTDTDNSNSYVSDAGCSK